MTSTNITVGLNEGRSSSRVLRPPGGGHTDIFGGEPDPQQTGSRRRQYHLNDQIQADSTLNNAQKEETPTNGTASPPQAETPQEVNEAPKQVESHKEQNKPNEEGKQEPARRGRVPPGGFSSDGYDWMPPLAPTRPFAASS